MQPLIPYIRQSRKKEKTISLDEQRRAIQAWAEHAGVKLAAEVVEQGVSGSKSWRERGLGAAVEACETGEASGIIVAFQDRLSREHGRATAEVWEALDKAGARFVAAAEGLDTATGDHELLFTIKAAIAREQWKRHKANWANATRSAIERGIVVGPTPLGYTKGRATAIAGTPDSARGQQLTKNAHAPAVEQAFRLRARGGSWADAARTLEAAGVPTPTGQTRWGISSVCSLVGNTIYKGELRTGHVHQFPEYAIVPPSVWAKAQPVKGEGRRIGSEGWAILAGLLFCAACGHRMAPTHTTRAGQTYRYYQCKSIKCDARASIAADEVEALVVEAAFAYFEVANPAPGVGRDSDPETLAALEIARDEAQRRFAAWEASSDPLDPGYAEKKAALREALQAAEAAILEERDAHRVAVSPAQMRAAFAVASAEEKRALVRGMLHGARVWRKGVEPAFEQGALNVSPLGERVEASYRALLR